MFNFLLSLRGTIRYYRIADVIFMCIIAFFSEVSFAQDHSVIVGNAVGEISSADGPATLQVDMGDCRFSMAIGVGEHVKFNDPDFVFYRASSSLADRDLPHLKQAEMTSGYDWWFEEPKSTNVPWMGLMCDSVSNFKWSSSPTRDNVSPELQDIMDSNALKCPANFDGKRWVPLQKNDSAIFKNLDAAGASGFVLEDKSKNGLQRSRFCFVHGESVLIGVSGNTRREDGSENDPILNVLRGIGFKSVSVPEH